MLLSFSSQVYVFYFTSHFASHLMLPTQVDGVMKRRLPCVGPWLQLFLHVVYPVRVSECFIAGGRSMSRRWIIILVVVVSCVVFVGKYPPLGGKRLWYPIDWIHGLNPRSFGRFSLEHIDQCVRAEAV